MDQRDSSGCIEQAIHLLDCSEQSDALKRSFIRNLQCLLNGETGKIASKDLRALDSVPNISELEEFAESGKEAISKLIVLKLNGGLGTSMGLEKAKSLLPVREGKSFLDIIVQQITRKRAQTGVAIPFVCMNSFRTEEDTRAVLPSDFNQQNELPLSVVQHKVPKLLVDSLLPIQGLNVPDMEWCPPGHGDLYPVLVGSGLLELALSKGYRYLFVSNADNLGATISESILGYMKENEIPFLMEVAKRTEVDKKGGHLARDLDGNLLLRERAQVEKQDEDDFQDISKYSFFNTNSIWIDLSRLQEEISKSDGVLPLPIIVNEKRANPSDSSSPKVVQLETAMGAAIASFPGAAAVCIDRDRFLPVKTTDDLLRMQSDLFQLTDEGHITAKPSDLAFPVSLDKDFYGLIDQYYQRFSHGVPSLKNASAFRVSGDVTFGSGIICHGEVDIVADGPSQVEDGTVLESRVVYSPQIKKLG